MGNIRFPQKEPIFCHFVRQVDENVKFVTLYFTEAMDLKTKATV